jgi:transglutaminase-like putative cysteine protease
MRIVAFPVAIALGAIGAIAAGHAHIPEILGFGAGAGAALLTVLALPSLPTRRATVVVLGAGGLGALRHASYNGSDRSTWLLVWAVATLVSLVMLDRADAEATGAMPGGAPLPRRGREITRVTAVIMGAVIIAAVALVPTVTSHLGRRVWPGLDPTNIDWSGAPDSLRASNRLDMTSRPRLTDKVVFTVDSPRASFWRGETFDQWDGSSWSRTNNRTEFVLPRDGEDNVQVPPPRDDPGAQFGAELRQTFHIETGYSDVVFAAPSPRLVETDKILHGRPDGTAIIGAGPASAYGKGAVYSVTSRAMLVTAVDLRAADKNPVPPAIKAMYAQPPVQTDRVHNLAATITATEPSTYDKIRAIEAWLGANTRYSLNAPLSPPGVDVVDDFLFRTKLGWCEQIASSLVVLARSVGIPARLTTGFAPGDRDGLTGRFVVRERDAHAWAEVYFPGVGWQDFDPTEATVPLPGDAKAGGSWLENARHHIVLLAAIGVLLVLAFVTLPSLVASSRRRRARRGAWSARTIDQLERIGRKAGRARAPAETPREYATVLARRLSAPDLETVGATLDTDAYSADGASPEAREAADEVLTSFRP